MDKLTFCVTLLVAGMGGTLVTLYAATLLIHALTFFFPPESSPPPKNPP